MPAAPAPAPPPAPGSAHRAGVPALLAAAMLLTGLYLPMLSARFDFRDDGDLVYPAAAMSPAARASLTWSRVIANWQHLGPFRPVLWAHWDLQAELLGANPLRWRLWRLLWTALAAASLLWLLAELRIGPLAAGLSAGLAMWTPAPNEIWRSLTLSEGIAMPYAVGALVCAVRAGRSRRPLGWDLAAIAGTLAALGCKSSFVALIPALILLRVAPDGEPLGAALRRHGARAALLALPALLPLVHLAAFVRQWHPGQYELRWPTPGEAGDLLRAVITGSGAYAIAASLIAAFSALPSRSSGPAARLAAVWARRRAAGRAGLALLAAGIAVYLPLHAVAGRYTIPAVWGATLLIAMLLDAALQPPRRRPAQLAIALFLAGLALVGGENLLRQEQAIARDAVLWEALERVEREAPPAAAVAWQGSADVVGEGIHFFWHLRGRGRGDIRASLLDQRGTPLHRIELPPAEGEPTWLVSLSGSPPAGSGWQLAAQVTRRYRWGWRSAECSVWNRAVP